MTTTTAAAATEVGADQVRLMSVVARLYHVQSYRQRDIADRLGVSQASVSRLLRQAHAEGIVQTVIDVPAGLHPELEERIEDDFGVSEVHVVEVRGGEGAMAQTLGRAAARLFSAGTLSGRVVGFAPGSPTLQAMAFALDDPLPRARTRFVVETLAPAGSAPQRQAARRATRRMADSLGATAVLLEPCGGTPGQVHQPGPSGLCPSRAMRLLDRLDLAFVDVGPVSLDQRIAPGAGTVQPAGPPACDLHVAGQVNQRWIDAHGRPVHVPSAGEVVGMTLPQLHRARRRVAIAGGRERRSAVSAAVRGRWVDVLVTDLDTARDLAERGPDHTLPWAGPAS